MKARKNVLNTRESISNSSTVSTGEMEIGEGSRSDGAINLDLTPAILRELIDAVLVKIGDMSSFLQDRPVAPDVTPGEIHSFLPGDVLPENGADPRVFVPETADMLLKYSTFNGHPRFFGYVTSSAAPLGTVADLLASAINANVGAWPLAPIATEIEAQTIRWLAQLIGFAPDCGGLLVSGGNMANITCALAARSARADWDIRRHGMQHPEARRMVVYASTEAHTWLEKAMDVMGLGTEAIRRVAMDQEGRMLPDRLRETIASDISRGIAPIMVVATAGTVSTGVIDPIRAIAQVCREQGVWFHVDGAYGAPAAILPEAPDDLHALSEADSVAIDPHKWLFAPIEAGCALVRRPEHLRDAFSYRPPYYHFDGNTVDEPLNYYEWGMQNSRGFRALKVWFILRQLGRSGFEQEIRKNIALTRVLHQAVGNHPLLEPFTLNLSISTFRFVPEDLRDQVEHDRVRAYLNRLNDELLTALQKGGHVFLSKAVVDDRFALRACIVNFRTSEADVLAVPGIVAELGKELDAGLRTPLQD